MSTNKDILNKADIAVRQLSGNGGLLQPEQASTFIRKLLVQPTMLSRVRRVTMGAPSRKVNKIQFADRILRAGAEAAGQADDAIASKLTNAQRSRPTTEQITLNTREVIGEVHLPYDVVEDSIERGRIGTRRDTTGSTMMGGIKDTIMTLIAERVAIDLEELALEGDGDSSDAYLALQDGWLKLASQNVVDAGGAAVTRGLLTEGMKALPVQYRRMRSSLAHFMTPDNEIDYRETIAARETAVGDAQMRSTSMVYGAGAPVVPVGLMPPGSGLLCNPQNLLFGIQRDIHIETDKDIRSRVFIIVVTARIALQIEETLALVKYTSIG